MDGETMSVRVDFETHQAASNVVTLTKALEDNAETARLVEQRHESAERKFRELGDAALAEARAMSAAAKETKEAGDAVQRAGEKADDAGKKFDTLGTVKAGIGKITQSLARDVAGMVGAYAGVQGVIAMFDRLQEAMKRTRQLQAELAGAKWSRDEQLLTVMDNLGIGGRAGEDQARALVNRFAGNTASTFDTALGTVAAASAAGFKMNDPNALGAATAAGKFAGRMRFGLQESEQLFKLMSNMGVRDEKGAKVLLSQLEATARETGVARNTELMGSMLQVVNTFTQRGGTLTEALAQYSTAATGAASAERGAETVQMALQLVDPGTPEARASLVAALAKRGVLKSGAGVTDADVDAAIAAQKGPAAQGAFDLQNRMAGYAQSDAESDASFAMRERELTEAHRLASAAPRGRGETREQRANREERARSAEEELRLLRLRRSGDLRERGLRDAKAGRELGDYREKVRTGLVASAAGGEFDTMPFAQKFDAVGAMFAEAEGDPIKQAELQDVFMGRPELLRSAQALFSRSFRQRAARTRAAVAAASPATQDAMFEQHKTTSFAQNATQGVSQDAQDDALVDAMVEETQRMVERGTRRARRDRMSGKKDGTLGGKFADEEDDASWGVLDQVHAEIKAVWDGLSPEQQAANPELKKLMHKVGPYDRPFTNEARMKHARAVYGEFLRIKAKGVGGGGSGGSVPLPDGATPTGTVAPGEDPGAFGPGAGAVNISIGNYFMHPGGERDLPGRLEGFLG